METRNFQPVQDSFCLASLITCYREVFSDEPWNEWLRCTSCNKVFGKNDRLAPSDQCTCGGKLTFFWETETVKNDIFNEITAGATCRIVTSGSEVVGFCWGYPINKAGLEKKLQLPGLAKTFEEKFGEGRLGYIDEVGIIPNLRLRGWGKNLWNQVVDALAKKGCQVIAARSQPNVRIFNWWIKTGYTVIQQYGSDDARVIIARAIDF